ALMTGWDMEPPEPGHADNTKQAGEEIENAAGGEADASEASLVGTLVHQVYRLWGPGCEWGRAASYVERELGVVNPERREEIRGRVHALLENGRRMTWPDAVHDGRREVAVLLRFGGLTLRGRIDLVWSEGIDGGIVDYKTNNVTSSDLDELVRSHGYDHQARLYALALQQARRLDRVHAELAFLDPGERRAWLVDEQVSMFYREQADLFLTRMAAGVVEAPI
ncbi:hypothetical protein GF324_08540, partial [bacterium]|nr:hypothetical protein [bacterium]